MKAQLMFGLIAACGVMSTASAQTPQPSKPVAPQERPDARYPNPSGQDSNPGTTTVKPTKTAPSTAHPRTRRRKRPVGRRSRRIAMARSLTTPPDAARPRMPLPPTASQRRVSKQIRTARGRHRRNPRQSAPRAGRADRRRRFPRSPPPSRNRASRRRKIRRILHRAEQASEGRCRGVSPVKPAKPQTRPNQDTETVGTTHGTDIPPTGMSPKASSRILPMPTRLLAPVHRTSRFETHLLSATTMTRHHSGPTS